jgi:FkbM family methyltransferase
MTEITLFSKRLVKRILLRMGLDIVRLARQPEYTLLGLRHRPFRTVLDVGASTGQFASQMHTIYPQAQVYAFEPLPEPFKALDSKAHANIDGRLLAFNMALGDRNGRIDMFQHVDHSPSSSILRSTTVNSELYPVTRHQAPTSVELRTLDGILAEMSLPLLPPVLIKLDVQGYEEHVIRGGQEAFRGASACIVEVNLDELYAGQAEFARLVVLLKNLGHCYAGSLRQRYAQDGHVVFFDAVFTKKETS